MHVSSCTSVVFQVIEVRKKIFHCFEGKKRVSLLLKKKDSWTVLAPKTRVQ